MALDRKDCKVTHTQENAFDFLHFSGPTPTTISPVVKLRLNLPEKNYQMIRKNGQLYNLLFHLPNWDVFPQVKWTQNRKREMQAIKAIIDLRIQIIDMISDKKTFVMTDREALLQKVKEFAPHGQLYGVNIAQEIKALNTAIQEETPETLILAWVKKNREDEELPLSYKRFTHHAQVTLYLADNVLKDASLWEKVLQNCVYLHDGLDRLHIYPEEKMKVTKTDLRLAGFVSYRQILAPAINVYQSALNLTYNHIVSLKNFAIQSDFYQYLYKELPHRLLCYGELYRLSDTNKRLQKTWSPRMHHLTFAIQKLLLLLKGQTITPLDQRDLISCSTEPLRDYLKAYQDFLKYYPELKEIFYQPSQKNRMNKSMQPH